MGLSAKFIGEMTDMPIDTRDRKISCPRCGTDITYDGRYKRPTECPLCYWKGRMENQEPIRVLLKRRSEIRARLDALYAAIAETESRINQRMAEVRAQRQWWQIVLGNVKDLLLAQPDTPEDEITEGDERSLGALQTEERRLKEEYSRLEMEVESATRVQKRYKRSLRGQIAKNKAEARHQKFCSTSVSNLDGGFERSRFHIQTKDYRRGNGIDNYFRNMVPDAVFAAFGKSCAFCGTSGDLTFDHYGLAKNEGGNFALISSDKPSIQLNIVVLCRGCNAAKGQESYTIYFNSVQRDRIANYQKALLDALLRDGRFLALVRKWAS